MARSTSQSSAGTRSRESTVAPKRTGSAATAVPQDRFSLFCTQVPSVSPVSLLRALPDEPAVLWQPPEGPVVLGLGEAGRIVASGPGRFAAVRQKATALLARIDQSALIDIEPVLLGGFAFSPDRGDDTAWQVLGDALFRLPRWTYRQGVDGAYLLGVIQRSADATTIARFTAEREMLLSLLSDLAEMPESEHQVPTERTAVVGEPVSELSENAMSWERGARDILDGIARGDLDKVVQARRQVIPLPTGSGVAEVLDGLSPHAGTATRFAIVEGSTAFVGASPERLVAKRGLEVLTEALAGTAAGEDTQSLLRSGKDRREQQLVVDEIVRALSPLCAQMDVPDTASTRTLRGLVHLVTPIAARLREPCHILDLVEVMHPTPAVGGLPAESAMQWIEANESAPRGWYAAPFGWIDRHGDGEFLVALRSSLLEPGRAHLYAGAGIVEGSDPTREFAEVELKLGTMRAALARGSD